MVTIQRESFYGATTSYRLITNGWTYEHGMAYHYLSLKRKIQAEKGEPTIEQLHEWVDERLSDFTPGEHLDWPNRR